jgi:hypothetical protein
MAHQRSFLQQSRLLKRIHYKSGGSNEVNINTSLLTPLVLSCALLTGCTVTTGSSSRAVRIAGEQQNVSSENKVRQLQQELKLAEQRVELEKKKREFAEERLKNLQEETDKSEAVENKSGRGS